MTEFHDKNLTPLEIDNTKETEITRQIQLIRSGQEVATRNMQEWWMEYDQLMEHYKSKRNSSICEDPEMLEELLAGIKNKIEKVI